MQPFSGLSCKIYASRDATTTLFQACGL